MGSLHAPFQAGVAAVAGLPTHDALTGLLNHREFHAAVEARVHMAPAAVPFAVVLLDLNHFRRVNDRHGHAEGDRLLCRVAEVLAANCRDSDVKARTGGDEFGLVLHGADAERADAICRQLSDAICALHPRVGVAFGFAVAPDDGVTREQLLLRADLALHADKRSDDRDPLRPGGSSRARKARRADDREVRAQLEAYTASVRSSYALELERTSSELRASYLATVHTLATAVEAKDDNTGAHIHRVHDVGLLLARAVAPEDVDDPQMAYGFLLHDIGKLSVPDAILTKPGALTDRQWALMRRHPEEGVRILSSVPFLGRALDVVRHHHERWDGGGYPHGLAGEAIPRWARIFSVVDTADAIMSDRPYREGRPLEVAVQIILDEAGKQFDPAVAEAFAALDPEELQRVWSSHAQAPPHPCDW